MLCMMAQCVIWYVGAVNIYVVWYDGTVWWKYFMARYVIWYVGAVNRYVIWYVGAVNVAW